MAIFSSLPLSIFFTLSGIIPVKIVLLLAIHLSDDSHITILSDCQQMLRHLSGSFFMIPPNLPSRKPAHTNHKILISQFVRTSFTFIIAVTI